MRTHAGSRRLNQSSDRTPPTPRSSSNTCSRRKVMPHSLDTAPCCAAARLADGHAGVRQLIAALVADGRHERSRLAHKPQLRHHPVNHRRAVQTNTRTHTRTHTHTRTNTHLLRPVVVHGNRRRRGLIAHDDRPTRDKIGIPAAAAHVFHTRTRVQPPPPPPPRRAPASASTYTRRRHRTMSLKFSATMAPAAASAAFFADAVCAALLASAPACPNYEQRAQGA